MRPVLWALWQERSKANRFKTIQQLYLGNSNQRFPYFYGVHDAQSTGFMTLVRPFDDDLL